MHQYRRGWMLGRVCQCNFNYSGSSTRTSATAPAPQAALPVTVVDVACLCMLTAHSAESKSCPQATGARYLGGGGSGPRGAGAALCNGSPGQGHDPRRATRWGPALGGTVTKVRCASCTGSNFKLKWCPRLGGG